MHSLITFPQHFSPAKEIQGFSKLKIKGRHAPGVSYGFDDQTWVKISNPVIPKSTRLGQEWLGALKASLIKAGYVVSLTMQTSVIIACNPNHSIAVIQTYSTLKENVILPFHYGLLSEMLYQTSGKWRTPPSQVQTLSESCRSSAIGDCWCWYEEICKHIEFKLLQEKDWNNFPLWNVTLKKKNG